MRAYTHGLDLQTPTSLVEASGGKECPFLLCRTKSRIVGTGNFNMVYRGYIT